MTTTTNNAEIMMGGGKEEKYDPTFSESSAESLQSWMTAPIDGRLDQIPGVNFGAKAKLQWVGIDSSFALIGKYLSLKNNKVSMNEHCDRFFHWLKGVGIGSSNAHTIVKSVGIRSQIQFPGIYDEVRVI